MSPETPETTPPGIEITIEQMDEVMEALRRETTSFEDPLQGFDFKMVNWDQPAPIGFSIDFMAETLWMERGLMLSDLQHMGEGWRPVPEVIFITVGGDNHALQQTGKTNEELGWLHSPSKTIILHTTGKAHFVETNVKMGRTVAKVELCIDYTSIEVVDAMPESPREDV